ncbi:MAG: hypothetical protein QM831_11350 [Kofleriaceae bacterium]
MKLVLLAIAAVAPHHRIQVIDRDHAQLRLTVTSKSATPREELVNVTIPHRYVVTGVAMTGGEEMVSAMLDRGDAWERYSDVVRQIKDPAVVEWIDDDHVVVRVFPVSRDQPAKVTLDLGMRASDVAHVTRYTSVLAVPVWAIERPQFASVLEPVFGREMFAPRVGDEEDGDD